MFSASSVPPAVRAHGLVHRGPRARHQAVEVAEEPHRHALGDEFVALPRDVLLEERHQGVDFLGGALPIFLGKGEQGENAHAGGAGAFDGLADRLHARLVAGRARQGARLRPPAVAVHDDGDVRRHRALLEDRVELGVAHPVTLP